MKIGLFHIDTLYTITNLLLMSLCPVRALGFLYWPDVVKSD